MKPNLYTTLKLYGLRNWMTQNGSWTDYVTIKCEFHALACPGMFIYALHALYK